jgi:hypothetical protein
MKLALGAILALWLRAVLLPVALLFRDWYPTFLERNAMAEDQAWNTLLDGWPDETISARASREKRPRLMALINWLFNDPRHCINAELAEINHLQTPEDYR